MAAKKKGDDDWVDESWFDGDRGPRGPENQRHGWIRTRLGDLGYEAGDLSTVWGRLEGKKTLDKAVASNFINLGRPVLTLERAIALAALLKMGLLEVAVRVSDRPLPDIAFSPLPDNLKRK